ncbi:MAG: hypothetical protein IJ003_01800 [Candidatus Gastranaerophilales bacterium]|nr:hypothetical protein [Candidatus Gastranaerophilales bacterium]
MIENIPSFLFMITGFLLSLYACVSNDAIQTLGTFLNTTKERPVWQIWLYVSAVMVLTFVIGWIVNDGDMAFGRLDRIPHAQVFYWWHILPPLVLLYLTKKGIPVATAFLIVSVFSSNTVIGLMIAKSFIGYVAALLSSLLLYFFIARRVEKIFLYMKNKPISKGWIVAKWLSTAFLWSAWLLQDGAVLFIYLPRKLTLLQMILSLSIFAGLLFLLCYKRGGEIQNIVKLKTNTQDTRSATIIDCVYACILLYFQNVNNIPMSTTWVFLGVLAGREIALYNRLRFITQKKVYKHLLKDITKAIVGLAVSITVVFILTNQQKIIDVIMHYINL